VSGHSSVHVVVRGSLESHAVEVVGEGGQVLGWCRGRAVGGVAEVGVRRREQWRGQGHVALGRGAGRRRSRTKHASQVVVEGRSRASTRHRVHVDGTRPRVLRAREGRWDGRYGTTSGLPLLPLVVAGARARPIVGVGIGVQHRRGQGTELSTTLRWGGVDGSGRGGVVVRGLHLLQE
jgi:hypothetical protein